LNLSCPLFLPIKPTSDEGLLSAEAERALIARAEAGEREANDRLLDAFTPLIRSEVKKFIRTHSTLMQVKDAKDIERKLKDIEQEVRICVLEAIREFDPNNGARLGTLAKIIIARRLPRQVYQRAPDGDALSRVRPDADWRESGRSATQPQPSLTHTQLAALIEISNLLRRVRPAALTPEEQTLIRFHYDDGDTATEAARRLGMSRPSFYKKHKAALGAMRDTLAGMGFRHEDAIVYLATLSRVPAPRTAPTPNPDRGKEEDE
jgi:DNA-directed RNA polymerase specialized sigma subunit